MGDSTRKPSWWKRLSGGLKRTSASLGAAISDLVSKRKLDAATLEELEDELIRADLGVESPARIAKVLADGRYEKDIAPDDVQGGARRRNRKGAGAGGDAAGDHARPFVILVIGVNGSGKTTTIGKLAAQFPRRGQDGDAGRRRHVPRRGHRTAQDLGRARRRRPSSRASRAPIRRALRSTRSPRPRPTASTSC